jgi:hypothetical protein
MSRLNVCVAVLLVAAAVVFAPSYAAATLTTKAIVVVSGSSAAWVDMALAAYNGGACALPAPAHSVCQHYTDNAATGFSSGFNLNDSRPTKVGGSTNVDQGHIWVVWTTNTSGTQYVWTFLKVDSIVGDRCFYGTPRCTITVPSGYSWSTLHSSGSGISSALWGNDTVPPTAVQALFGPGVTVNTAATDIRPEDAQFEACRVNSALGKGAGFEGNDGLDGLGYNSNNASGTCPSYPVTLAEGVGTPISSGISGSTATANVLAFNITGHDPFTNDTVAAGTTLTIGAAPVVFVISRTSTNNSGFTGCARKLCNITDAGAQHIFSGGDCSASQVSAGGSALPAAAINAFLREPNSGTMTTAEMHVFRRPVDNISHTMLGTSQETGVAAATLSATACTLGGGTRTRGIGTAEVMNGSGSNGGILNSGGSNNDGIAYTFWGFGNINKLWNSANYSYLTLDGVDPIGPFTGTGGPWAAGVIPNCTAPCAESQFWSGNSFPGLRSGDYTAWALLHIVTAETVDVEDLLTIARQQAVESEPDFIPVLATTAGGIKDPGVNIFKTHYDERQTNVAGTIIGSAPTNGTFVGGYGVSTATPPVVATDHGGDAGGCTYPIATFTSGAFKKNYIQSNVTESGGSSVATCAADRH